MLYLTFVVIILANVADYLSTQYALRRNPNAKEGNPIVVEMGLLESKIVSVIINCWLMFMMRDAALLLALQSVLVGGLYGYVTYNNIQHAR